MDELEKSIYEYKEYKPASELEPFIECYWHLKINGEISYEIIPDGFFDIIFEFHRKTLQKAILTGIWSKNTTVNYQNETENFGIRFKVTALDFLDKLKIDKLKDSFSDYDFSNNYIDREIFLKDYFSDINLTIDYLNKCFISLSESRKKNDIICFFYIVESLNGQILLEDLSNGMGLGVRQIHRKVKDLIGLSPKEYIDIVRMRNTLESSKDIVDGYSNYYDQSHYIRKFKKYFFTTPGNININDDRFLQYKNKKR